MITTGHNNKLKRNLELKKLLISCKIKVKVQTANTQLDKLEMNKESQVNILNKLRKL